MKRFLLIVVAVAVAVVAVAAVVSASALAHVSDVVAYSDPAGDSGGEVDITLVSIDTDPATGMVTFAVTVTGFDPGSMDGRARFIQVYLATDASWSTGFADLALIVEAGPQGLVPYVAHPKPGDWPFEPLPSTISFSQSGDALTWGFNKSEFGSADGFNFLLYTTISATVGGPASIIADHAPDGVGRAWRYHYVQSEPEPAAPAQPVVIKPVFGSATTAPSRPVAGKRLVFTLAVNRSDTGAPLTTGRMVCDPSIAGVVLKHTESFKNGKARLSLVIPKTAKGKLLKVSIKITSGTKSATKIVTYKVT